MVSQEFLGEFIKETVLWKTFIPVIKLNRFLKIKLFPAVLGLLKYCFMYTNKSYMFRLKNYCLVTIRNLLLSKVYILI
jgi:hypothetical protein